MSKNLFNSIAIQRPKYSAFDNTHDHKLSFNMGQLIPIMCEDVVPGSYHKLGGSCMLRFAPMIAPVMHRIDVTMHYFFVPYRILWPGWEKWISNDEDAEAFPTITVQDTTLSYTRLLDHMGIPIPLGANIETISALFVSAYNKIYNDYYRDQNLIPEIVYELIAGNNDLVLPRELRYRAWEHDYLTSALPFAQKGAAVDIPLGDVELKSDWFTGSVVNPRFKSVFGDVVSGEVHGAFHGGGTAANHPGPSIAAGEDGDLFPSYAYDPQGSLTVAATTINDLRRAEMLQEWLELNARAGTRYTEFLQAHFNVKPEDARLQRPEYITGVKNPVVISEVLNTTGTEDLPQGNMAGHGISVASGHLGSYAVKEHGCIMGIASVMPKTAYQQGIPRQFLKTQDPFQYFFKQFENIGEQEVLNKEVYAFQGVGGNNTFGYNPRYSEYKFANNRVSGEFRTTQNFWHAGRIFSTPPALNAQFVTADPTYRIFAVEDSATDHLYCHVLNKWTAIQPMDRYSTPHF